MEQNVTTDVRTAAIILLKHKMLIKIGEAANSQYDITPVLDVNDINEVLVVAGIPVIVPDDINKKLVDVISTVCIDRSEENK